MREGQDPGVAATGEPIGAEPGSIFHEDWWAEAANPGAWDRLVCVRDNVKVAEFLYTITRRSGFREVGHPYLARTVEPRIWLPPAKPTTHLTNLVGVVREVREKLPEHDLFWCNLPPDNALELAYSLAGYDTHGAFTFRTQGLDRDAAWTAMDAKTRNQVRTAQKTFGVETHADLDRFIALSKSFLRARAWRNSLDYAAVERIFAACVARDRAQVLTASDDSGRDVASSVVVWDDRHLYFWMAARDPDRAGAAANSVLIWRAIELAIERGLIFDMDGFASPSAGLFYAKFGLTPRRRTHVRWTSRTYNWVANGRDLVRSLLPRGREAAAS